MTPPRPRARTPTAAERVLSDDSATLLDIVDNVLNKGVVLTGEVMIGLARIDLVYARVSLLLCAADQILPGEGVDPRDRRIARRRHRRRSGGRE